ncbi:MAG TPA: protein kinase [Kofleriaceae bacterium]|nr:protein kinase [Kofleriaceae bacterium]
MSGSETIGMGETVAPAAAGDEPDLPLVPRASYDVLDEYSRGGLGRILRARDRRTGRVVAIKEVLKDHGEAAARFRREAMLTANLQHPAIVPVYEVGRWEDGQPFYAMKLVAGRSLAQAIEDAGGREARLGMLGHVSAVADALAYAHDLGIIHRDLKPANVLVGRFGETVVIDWGLAKDLKAEPSTSTSTSTSASTSPSPSNAALDATIQSGSGSGSESGSGSGSGSGRSDLTMAGALIGTPAYMAPEQARGEEVDARADVFALGAMLYHLLAGEMPHAGASSVDELLERVRRGPPRPLRAVDAELPTDLCAIAEKAMSHARRDRYATAKELAEDLHRFQTGQLVRAHDYTARQLVARWIRRHRAMVALGAVAVVALAATGVYSVQRVRRERDSAQQQRAKAMHALDAEQRATRANARSMSALHQELGRQELERGSDQRALVHLVESARLAGELGPGLAHLLGRVTASFDAFLWRERSGGTDPAAFALSRDGRVLMVALSSGRLERRDAATGDLLNGIDLDITVAGADFTPDGRWIAAAGKDLVMWDAGGSGELHRVAGDDGHTFLQVAISPRGVVAAGDLQGRLALLPLGASAVSRRWEAHGAGVGGLAWRGDGGAFVSKAEDGSAFAWDDQGERLAALSGGGGAHHTPAIDRAGSRVAVIDRSAREVVIYRTDTFAPVARLAPPGLREQSFVSDVWLSPDGTRAITTLSDLQPLLWDVERAAVIAELSGHSTGVMAASFLDDGRLVVTSDPRGIVRGWDAVTGELTHTLSMNPGQTFLLAADPTGLRAFVVHQDGMIAAWDLGQEAWRIALVGHGAQARRVVYTPDGARVVTASHDATVRVWDTRTGRELVRIAHPGGRAVSMDVSRDGTAIVTAGADGNAHLWDAATGAPRASMADGRELATARFLPDGRVVTAGAAGVLRVWRQDGTLVCAAPPLDTGIFSVALSRDGATALAYAEGPVSTLHATDDCRVLHSIETHHHTTVNAAFSADGKTVAITGYVPQGTAPGPLLVDVATGAVRPLPAPRDVMTVTIAFHPDSEMVATGDATGTIRLWNARTLEQVKLLDGARTTTASLLFTPDGGLLIAGFDDGAILVWEIDGGRLLTTLQGHTGGVYWLQLRPDGRQLASAGLDPVPRLWSFPHEQASIVDLSQLARCLAPFRLEEGMPVPAEPMSCTPRQRRRR